MHFKIFFCCWITNEEIICVFCIIMVEWNLNFMCLYFTCDTCVLHDTVKNQMDIFQDIWTLFYGKLLFMWEKFGPLGSCKIQVPLYIKLPGMKIAPKIKKRRGEGKKRRGDRQKRRRGDGRRRRGERQKKRRGDRRSGRGDGQKRRRK